VVYGAAKRRDIARSVLPSTRQRAARRAKASAHRASRRSVAQRARSTDSQLSPVEDAGITRRERIDIRHIVQWRRRGDKLGPLLRWGRATTRMMPIDDRLPYLRGTFDDNLIGRHAISHLRWDPAVSGQARPVRARPQPIITADDLTETCGRLLADGQHGALNRAIKLAAPDAQPYRLLLGAHDVDTFVAHLLAHGIAQDPRWKRAPEPPEVVVVRAWAGHDPRARGPPRSEPSRCRPAAGNEITPRSTDGCCRVAGRTGSSAGRPACHPCRKRPFNRLGRALTYPRTWLAPSVPWPRTRRGRHRTTRAPRTPSPRTWLPRRSLGRPHD